ncbi:hypothetical protein MNBD_GAMMA10-2605, partial [hydrothermal vent metagenome]
MHYLPRYTLFCLLALLGACTGSTGDGDRPDSNSTDTTSRFTLGGTLSGISNASIQLSTNGITLTTSTNGAFSFPANFINGSNYNVTLVPPLNHNCTISNGTGTINGADISSINVTCVLNSSSISGNVSSTVLIVVDNDINDPGAKTNVSNNLTTSAQVINNLSTVQGFVSAVGTGRAGDRFTN